MGRAWHALDALEAVRLLDLAHDVELGAWLGKIIQERDHVADVATPAAEEDPFAARGGLVVRRERRWLWECNRLATVLIVVLRNNQNPIPLP